jgi:hypothetical protein
MFGQDGRNLVERADDRDGVPFVGEAGGAGDDAGRGVWSWPPPGASRIRPRGAEAGLKRCMEDLPGCASTPAAAVELRSNGARPRSGVPSQVLSGTGSR